MHFRMDHTYDCMKASEIRLSPKHHQDVRCSLLGNAFHPAAIALLVGQLLASLGVLPCAPTLAELSRTANRQGLREVPGERSDFVVDGGASSLRRANPREPRQTDEEKVVRYLLAC